MTLPKSLPNLTKYKSRRIVQAAKIIQVHHGLNELVLHDKGESITIRPSNVFWLRFDPKVGGWFVLDKDGAATYRTASAFEEDFDLLEDVA